MNLRIRATLLALTSSLAGMAFVAPSTQAGLLSILPGSCGNQPVSQPFARWNDSASYTPVPGGNFEAGGMPWLLTGRAQPVNGNETFNIAGGSRSLSLPTNSSAISPASCTNIYHPTLRFFLRNTGSPTSRLTVQALYPGLLGGTMSSTVGQVSGTSLWEPSSSMPLLVSNLLATLSLNQTVIAFRFAPADSSGKWSIDDVYLDPFKRS